MIEQVLFDVIHFIGSSILIGHHVQFDIRFLNKTLYHLCRGHLRHPYLDTMVLYTAAIFQALAPRLSRADQPVSSLITCQRAVGLFRQF